MQFVLVIYHGSFPLPGTPQAESVTEEQRQSVYADFAALGRRENVKAGPPLGLPADATTVRVVDGSTVTADGPFRGVENAIGGYAVVEADDLAAAVEIAASIPQARMGGAVEVRPSEKYW
ncbi:hypothetical protein DFR70_104585 [Nocardia tenerifensis]|uniref:YCII-related domain-containing protein n=2 Tax=Nocardia tenerifensis TaxID=228006 RepID=A0A318K3S3_9NOCA|nr:YciI family protein [Nocardia tenerifensis]PXX65520.1 hypothetical protein DFR70_104585 [Nocardia tenerifensis]